MDISIFLIPLVKSLVLCRARGKALSLQVSTYCTTETDLAGVTLLSVLNLHFSSTSQYIEYLCTSLL